jgi:hypothetical protein
VQVCRKLPLAFTEGPGLTGSWDKTKAPIACRPVDAFSSWTNGERTLNLDATGKATYKLPLDWWKDQARQVRRSFIEDYFYRALAFKDASGGAPRFSSANSQPAPSVKVHNNLVSFIVTDAYTPTGEEKTARVELTVREPHTKDMYTIVQWIIGGSRVSGPTGDSYPVTTAYGFKALSYCSQWAIDSSRTDPRPFYWAMAGPQVSPDGKTATGTDIPGGKISAGREKFTFLNFQTLVHLNFEVPATVKITKKVGAAEPYDEVIGELDDPQPFSLESQEWQARILQVIKSDGSVDVSHPDTYKGLPSTSVRDAATGVVPANAASSSAASPITMP